MTARAPEMPQPPSRYVAAYRARKNAGLCVRASSHGPAEPGRSLCAGCAVDFRYDRRFYYRAAHPAAPGRGCARCGGDDGHNARSCTGVPLPNYRPGNPERDRRAKERHEARRAAGLCINNPNHARPQEGRPRCDACMARRRKAAS